MRRFKIEIRRKNKRVQKNPVTNKEFGTKKYYIKNVGRREKK